MKIQTLSDTHNNHDKFKAYPCDVIIYAGDFSANGTEKEAKNFLEYFGKLEVKNKILVPGNHDVWAEKNLDTFRELCNQKGITLLVDEAVTIDSIKFWGSPITLRYGHGWAWNRDPSEEKVLDSKLYRKIHDAKFIGPHWDLIPDDSDVVICHQPCYGILDEVVEGAHAGCPLLLDKITHIKPSLFVCGHIHQARGKRLIDSVTYINTATVTAFHEL